MLSSKAKLSLALVIALLATAGSSQSNSAHHETSRKTPATVPLVLSLEEGERRVRKWSGSAPKFTIKVDRRNGGSQHLVMGYEDIPVGGSIPPHRHLNADEIVFVHKGSGVVENGSIARAFDTGATIFIPRETRVTIRNTGTEPVSIAFFFSHPGFEEYMRDTSAPEGEAYTPLTPEELATIRKRHSWHADFNPK
jgi:quercetin dioxygenase-like cupin family protein